MKKSYVYRILLTAAVLTAFTACERDIQEGVTEQGISIAAVGSNVDTRSMLDAADIQEAGTKVRVFDYLTGFTGKIGNQNYTDGNVLYFDDAVEYGSGQWSFASGTLWRWTRTGVHNFYGLLVKDKDGKVVEDLVNVSYSDSRVLTIPAITCSKSTAQFDFSYSDIVPVDVEATTFDPTKDVNLPLHHLFSALGVSIENSGIGTVNIKSVSLDGLKSKKSASIDFSGTQTDVSLIVPAGDQPQYLANLGTGRQLAPGGSKIDLVTGNSIAVTASSECFLMWPQTAAEVDAMSINVIYTIDGVYVEGSDTELQEFNKNLMLRDTPYFRDGSGNKLGMDAGKRYWLNLQFKAKSIDLTIKVLPWDYTEYDLDYANSSISARPEIANEGVLWLYTATLDIDGNEIWTPGDRNTREVTLASNRRVKGDFYIGSPHSGSWQITTYTSPLGMNDLFRVEPSTGEITEDLINNNQGKVEFYVYPNGPINEAQVTLYFNISFRFNGESQWRDGNTEFNRKNWHVVREAGM